MQTTDQQDVTSIATAWLKFIETGTIDSAVVRSEIADSWLRSYRAGIDPAHGISDHLLSGNALEELLEKRSDLINIASDLYDKPLPVCCGFWFHCHPI